MKILISVIMTVYNAEDFLEETILSILKQTYQNFEFLIVNDNSTDRSLKILEKYEKLDNRIKVINLGKLGRGKALNVALENSKGEYIANIDSDDPSYSNRLEVQKEYLDKNSDVVLVGSDSIIIDEKSQKIGEMKNPRTYKEIKNIMPKKCPFNHSSVMYRKNVILKIGGYNQELSGQLDYDLWIRILKDFKAENIAQILVTKRIHKNQYFEGNILTKSYRLLLKNQVRAIKELKLSKINYIYIIRLIIKISIPRKIKLYIKNLNKNI
ncbi:glycosyltransferase [Cetobacterium sp. ZOR0034]|uniref:glycosyltransferase n=1 Tax=Cetobacterium sp. ZOR0034 TaxID=1339239 RepID=UPI00068D8F5B|nr:glycosyltransferase [Cetobacterium sp. ZOR0034]